MAPPTKLGVGGQCAQGHEIKSEDDLSFFKVRRRSGNGHRVGKRCRLCKKAGDRKDKRFVWRTILDIGHCRIGHEINSHADVYMKSYSDGREAMFCLQCKDEYNTDGPSISEKSRRAVIFSCSCELWFDAPIPEVGDDVYCAKHRSPERVVRWLL